MTSAMVDCRFEALRNGSYLGAYPDMWRAHMLSTGVTAAQINDMEKDFLEQAGYPGNINDGWFNWLGAQGYTGALMDRWHNYWCDAKDGSVGLPALFLLDARFDSYPGIEDQSLSDGQVLGRQQGSETGGLTIAGANHLIEGGYLRNVAGAAWSVDYSFHDGNNVQTGYWYKFRHRNVSPVGSDAHVGLIAQAAAGGSFGNVTRIAGFRPSSTVLQYRASGNITIPGAAITAGGYWDGLFILGDLTSEIYHYYKDNSGIWSLAFVGSNLDWGASLAFDCTANGVSGDLEQVDLGTDASAILDAGNTIGPVDTLTAALIDALSGDIVSASFGPADDASNTQQIFDGALLTGPESPDYPIRSADIRKGTLALNAGGGRSAMLSGKVFSLETSALGDNLTELYANTREPGLTAIVKANYPDVPAYALQWGRFANPTGNSAGFVYRMSWVAGNQILLQASDGASVVGTITLPGAVLNSDFEITLGGFDVAGEPQPDGDYGAIFRHDGKIVFSVALLSFASPHASVGAVNANSAQWLWDTVQTKVDKPRLATVQRALFTKAADELVIENYFPENGVLFTETPDLIGITKIESGGLVAQVLTDTCGVIYENPDGGYWETAFEVGDGTFYESRINVRADKEQGLNVFSIIVSGHNNLVLLYEGSTSRGSIPVTLTPLSEVKLIVTDDKSSISVIAPGDSQVLNYVSTSLNSNEHVYLSFIGNVGTTQSTKVLWHCARMGTMLPYVVLSSNIPNFQFNPLNVPITPYEISQHFAGANLTFALTSGAWPTGISMDTAGQVTGTPTLEEANTGLVITAGVTTSNTFNAAAAESFELPVTAGLVGFLDASDISTLFVDSSQITPVTDDGDVVGAWLMQPPLTETMTQFSTARKGTYRAAVANGLSAIDFGDVSIGMVGETSAVVPFSIFLVEESLVAGGNRTLSSITLNSIMSSNRTVSNTCYVNNGNVSNATATGRVICRLLMGAAASSFHYNNVDVTVGGNAVNMPWGSLDIGDEGTGGNSPGMRVYEILVYDRVVDAGEITQIESYLTTKWGIT